MYFDEIFIPHGQQAVAFKVPGEMVVHRVLIQVFALDQELCVIPKFRHTAALLFYFFAFILIWFITELAKLIEGKTDFHTLYLYSLLISLVCSVLLIMYVAGFIAQLIIHIQHQKERTLLPVWCMLTAVLMLVPLFEDFSILGSSWNFKGYFLSIVAYIAYLFTKLPKVIESYRYHATIRYAVWVALVLGIILSML